MPRLGRLVIPGVAMHITQRGHDRQACFRHETDYLVYLSALADLLLRGRCHLHAFCLMTNHVHLLLTPRDPGACGTLIRDLGQRYVQYFNRRYQRRGTLWEGRFGSCVVDSAQYVIACHRYIERNPVRAGMVGKAADYPWSSYAANAGFVESMLLTPHEEYLALSEDLPSRQWAYRQLVEEEDQPSFLAAVRDATKGGYPMLGADLKAKLAAESGRHLERRRPGPAPVGAKEQPDLLTAELGLCPRTS